MTALRLCIFSGYGSSVNRWKEPRCWFCSRFNTRQETALPHERDSSERQCSKKGAHNQVVRLAIPFSMLVHNRVVRSAAYLTLSETLAECDSVPAVPLLLPVMVRLNVPRCVAPEVETVRVDVPAPLMEDGVKAALDPLGNPPTLKLTVSPKPPMALIVTV